MSRVRFHGRVECPWTWLNHGQSSTRWWPFAASSRWSRMEAVGSGRGLELWVEGQRCWRRLPPRLLRIWLACRGALECCTFCESARQMRDGWSKSSGGRRLVSCCDAVCAFFEDWCPRGGRRGRRSRKWCNFCNDRLEISGLVSWFWSMWPMLATFRWRKVAANYWRPCRKKVVAEWVLWSSLQRDRIDRYELYLYSRNRSPRISKFLRRNAEGWKGEYVGRNVKYWPKGMLHQRPELYNLAISTNIFILNGGVLPMSYGKIWIQLLNLPKLSEIEDLFYQIAR